MLDLLKKFLEEVRTKYKSLPMGRPTKADPDKLAAQVALSHSILNRAHQQSRGALQRWEDTVGPDNQVVSHEGLKKGDDLLWVNNEAAAKRKNTRAKNAAAKKKKIATSDD